MKKLISFLGAFGSGKTTAVKNLELRYKYNYEYVYEGDTILDFLKQKGLYFRQSSFLNIIWYKLLSAIKNVINFDKLGVITDTHPIHGLIYAQTFFEIENGIGLNLRDLSLIQSMHYNLWKHFYHKIHVFDNIVYYINLPIEINYQNVEKRNRAHMGELDMDYLLNVRKNMDFSLRRIAESMYNAKVIEINSLEELDKIEI